MRIKGPAFRLRDSNEEWGQFRLPTIEALVHIGKVTEDIEVMREGTTVWIPITSDPDLAPLFGKSVTPTPTTQARVPTPAKPTRSPGTPLPSPAPPTGQRRVTTPSPGQHQAVGLQPPGRSVTSTGQMRAMTPAPGGRTTTGSQANYRVIRGDGTLLGPFPLPMLLAHIWDGEILGEDLVRKEDSDWRPAMEYPELSQALVKASQPELPVVTAAQDVTPLPSATGESPVATPPSAEQPQAAAGGIPQDVLDGGVGAEPSPPPRPTPRPLTPPPPDEEDDEAETVVAPAPTQQRKPLFSGRLESTPILKILGRIFRTNLTGTLKVTGPCVVELTCSKGRVVDATRDLLPVEVELDIARFLEIPDMSIEIAKSLEEDTLLMGLEASGSIDEATATSFRSMLAFETAMGPFAWRSGSFEFFRHELDGEPVMYVHPFEFLRAGVATGFTKDEIERQSQSWMHAAIQKGASTINVDMDSLPLLPEERGLLDLVDEVDTVGTLLDSASEKLDIPRERSLRILFLAYNLGLVTLVSGRTLSSSRAAVAGLFDPAQPLSEILAKVRSMDLFTLLGVPRKDDPGDVDAAFNRAKDQVRGLTGDRKLIGKILARLELAKRCLSDPKLRKEYLIRGDELVKELEAEEEQSRTSSIRIRTQEILASRVTSAKKSDRTKTPPIARLRTPSGEGGGLAALTEQNYEKAEKLIEARKYKEAQRILRQLVKVHPTEAKFNGLMAWANYLDSKRKHADNLAAIRALEQALRLDKTVPDIHYFLGRIYLAEDNKKKAKVHFKKALELEPGFEKAKKALETASRRNVVQDSQDARKLGAALGFYVILFAGLFYTANVLGHDPTGEVDSFGVEEYYYHPTCLLFYVRRAALLLVGLLGSYVIFRPQRPRDLWSTGVMATLAGAIFGLASWGLFPVTWYPGEIPPMLPVAGMVLLHAVAEEHFFRGFLTRALLPYFEGLLPALTVSGLLYGLYHLTFASFWWGLHPMHLGQFWNSMPAWVLRIAVTMGIPLAWFYAKSRSVIPGILAQLAFGWSYLLLSISSAQG